MAKTSVVAVREIMSKDLVTVDPDATVAEALSLMEKSSVHELPVMNGATLRGWLSYRTLARHGGFSGQAKVASVMDQPPRVGKDASIVDAAALLIQTNARAGPVVDGKGKVVGLLSRTDILRSALEIPGIAATPVERAMVGDLETITPKETLDKALARMRDLRLGQLLVLRGDGRLQGYVGLEDLVHAYAQEHAPRASDRGRGSRFQGSGGEPAGNVELQSFVRDAPTIARGATLGDAIQAMIRRGTAFVAVAEDGYAVGIVSRSNVVERVAALKPEEGVLCQVVGLSEHVDGSQLEAVYDLAQKTLRKVQSEVKIEFLSLHYKVYKEKADGAAKFSLTLHLSTEGKFFVQKADAWDPLDATRKALTDLESRVMNLKDLRLERRKGTPRRRTSFYDAAEFDARSEGPEPSNRGTKARRPKAKGAKG